MDSFLKITKLKPNLLSKKKIKQNLFVRLIKFFKRSKIIVKHLKLNKKSKRVSKTS